MTCPHILLVDDESHGLAVLKEVFRESDYRISFAKNGKKALELIGENPPNLILLDIVMPEMDGWELLDRLKLQPKYRDIPVIIQSGLQSVKDFQRGLALGAYYFVTKPIEPDRLLAMVRATLEGRQRVLGLIEQLHTTDGVLALTKSWKVEFRTLEHVNSLSKIVAKICPEPDRVISGLSELLINAVEHGIAQINYLEKGRLVANQGWQKEVERRLNLPTNQNKYASLSLSKENDKIVICIEDPGRGFCWRDYLEFSMERATDNHGRGIALAKALSFKSLEYSEQGNKVTVII